MKWDLNNNTITNNNINIHVEYYVYNKHNKHKCYKKHTFASRLSVLFKKLRAVAPPTISKCIAHSIFIHMWISALGLQAGKLIPKLVSCHLFHLHYKF